MDPFLKEAWDNTLEHNTGIVDEEETKILEVKKIEEAKKRKKTAANKAESRPTLIESYFTIKKGIEAITDPELKADLELFLNSVLESAQRYSQAIADHIYANRKDVERDFGQEREAMERTDYYRRQMHLGLINSLTILCRLCTKSGIDIGNLRDILYGSEDTVRPKVAKWALTLLDYLSLK